MSQNKPGRKPLLTKQEADEFAASILIERQNGLLWRLLEAME